MVWLLVFFLTPIAEMYLLIEVADIIDAWPTIGLVMLTAIIGVALLKRQGLATLTRGMNRMQQGEVPAREMAEGLLLAVAGALLLTPGFITDTVGFVLLFPPSRMMIASALLKRVEIQGVGAAQTQFYQASGTAGHNSRQSPHATVEKDGSVTIEGDFERRH